METSLKTWRRRCGEGWIAGADGAVLCDVYTAFQDERARHPGGVRVQLADANPAYQLAGLFAALGDGDPLDVFLTPGHGLPAEMETFEAAVAADLYWSGRELVSCGRARVERIVGPCTRVMIATGGTTAGPRFAVHTWATLESAALGLQAWLECGPIDSVCVLPLHHVSGLMQAVRSYATGGVLTLWDWSRAASGHFPSFPAGDRTAVISLVPTQLARLLDLKDGADWLRGFHGVFLGGAAAWPELLARARAERISLAPCYGMTETAAQITTLRPQEFLEGAGGVGAVLPHASVDIVDESGALVPAGAEGRVRVRARSLFFGYFPDPEPQPRAFLDTNDRGVLDGRGRLTVLGRIDSVINTGGEKVEPLEVEAAIRALGAADVSVFGAPDAHWGETVVAVVVGCALADADLHTRLRQILAPHKVPKRFIRAEALPRSEAGKLDRRALRALLEIRTPTGH